jgi:molybdenum cofactor cytidylyltransferase
VIAIRESAAILLCAGLSRRFGQGDKLMAPLEGRPLVSHAAALAGSLPFARRVAVVPAGEAGPLRALLTGFGFELVENDRPEEGKDRSLRLGLASASGSRARGMLVLLGDMPFPDSAHLLALAEAAGAGQAAISATATWRSPPLMIPAALAARILADRSTPARDMLADAAEVRTAPEMLADFDSPLDFESSLAQEETWPA